MVNLIVTGGVKLRISLNSVIKYTSLRDLLRLEALVFRQILTVIVAQVVVGNHGSEAETRTDKEVTHNCLKACLATLEVISSKKCTVIACHLNNGWVESVLG